MNKSGQKGLNSFVAWQKSNDSGLIFGFFWYFPKKKSFSVNKVNQT